MLGTETPSGKVTISKTTLYGIVFAAIVLTVVIIYFLDPWSPSSTNNVRIDSFSKEEGRIIGEQMTFPFSVEIYNFGSNDVSGLEMVVKLVGDHSELGSDSKRLSTLQAGHSRRISFLVILTTSDILGKDLSYVATLYLDDTVIDESTLP